MIDVVPAKQGEMFSILRREQLEDDQLPQDRRDGFTGGRLGQLGLNTSLARRATTQIGDIWVIPGNGWIALGGHGAVATPAEVVARQGTVMWTSREGKGIVFGLVPDGVSEVTLVDHEDASINVLVNDNVYGAILNAPLQLLRLTGPTGEVELGSFS